MSGRKYLLFVFTIMVLGARAQHPFKYDHTIYKTVYIPEAFRLMDSMQNYLLLDVRSQGEYDDTSRATALDIGRIRGSENLPVDAVPAHLAELKKYIDQPIFIYCSHSQRSRRVSKLLAENGFKKVYNINGGMTQLNEMDSISFPYKNKVLITSLSYKNMANTEAYQLIKHEPGLVIVDIRTGPEFGSNDSLQQNNIGHLKNAINIPQAFFAEKFDSFRIPKNSPILLYDLHGFNSMDVVSILRAKGFTNIYNLFEGLEGFISDHRLSNDAFHQLFVDPPPYKLLDPKGCIDLMLQNPALVILDTRPVEEFNNTAKMTYLNLGHIRGAIHVASMDSLEIILQKKDTSNEFLIYGSGTDLGAIVCDKLTKKGYRQVNFLIQGLYNFVWSTANIEDCRAGRAYLTDHEELY